MPLRILVMESDTTSRRQLHHDLDGLQQLVVVAETRNPAEAIEAARKGADVAIIEVSDGSGGTQALDCINHLVRLVPGISVIASGSGESADLVIRAIRAGAVEFLRRPITKDELAAAIEKIRRVRKGPSSGDGKIGRVVSVYAIKGGLGVTTLATNLAASLAQSASNSVIVVDLDLRQGGISTLLNLHPTYTTMDAFGQSARLDEAFLRGLLTRHGSGLHVLAAPPAIERSRFTSEQISEGLEVIRSVFSCVVLDLPHDLDPSTVTALDGSDDVLYMVGLSVPAVRVSAAGLQALKHIGIEQRKIKVVVSRADAREDVSLKQAREALGLSVFWRIPNDYPTVVSSVNDGTPFVLSSPRSEIARNIRQLGEKLSQGPVSGAEGTAKATSLLRRVLPYAI